VETIRRIGEHGFVRTGRRIRWGDETGPGVGYDPSTGIQRRQEPTWLGGDQDRRGGES
jgi:hypothetical protein